MDGDTDMIPSSPSVSSLSSSDLDTESTGSFFPDRSTSLGTLMGVTFPEISAARPPSLREQARISSANIVASATDRKHHRAAASAGRSRSAGGAHHHRDGRRGRRWWMLCREEDMARRTSLGDFLQVERRLSVGEREQQVALYYSDGIASAPAADHEVAGGGRPLFEDGKVLPPSSSHPQRREQSQVSLARLPVLLTGICSGGDG